MNENGYRGKPVFKIATAFVLVALLITSVVFAGQPQNPPVSQPVTGAAKGDGEATTYHDVYLALRKSAEEQRRLYGGEAGLYEGDMAMEDAVAMEAPAADGGATNYTAKTAAADVSREASYGKTNVQVEGVDEADIVKNDGRYLYILSDKEEKSITRLLSIVDISSMTLMSQTRFSQEEYFQEMYVKDDRLILLGSQTNSLNAFTREGTSTYDYSYGSHTRVLIYDITDRKNIRQVREFSHDGDYVSSRLVSGNLYIISTYYHYFAFDDLTEETVDEIVPYTEDSATGASAKPLPAGCIAISQNTDSTFTVVSGLDIANDTPASTKTVMGAYGGIVYSTPSHLYVTNGWNADTELMRYSLRGGQVTYDGKTTIPGFVNDQFALDEYNGYLRVATTSYQDETHGIVEDGMSNKDTVDFAWGGNSVNNLYILDEDLNITGKVEGLAEGEIIQSVRYMGSMAYVVTFRQTDPLFAIDVSNPQNPVVLGQLKIPGFSSYMHPIDEDTLLGIGFDADEETGGTTGLKLSLFDVSDPINPIETHKLVIPGECYSAATANHKAVTYIAEKNLLAIPLEIYSDISVSGKQFSVNGGAGVFVIKVDKKQGLSLQAALTDPHVRLNAENGWWDYSFNRLIHRTTYLNDAFLTISNQSVLRYNLNTFALEKQLDLFA